MRSLRRNPLTWMAALIAVGACARGAARLGAADGDADGGLPRASTAPPLRDDKRSIAFADAGTAVPSTALDAAAPLDRVHVIGRVDTRDPAGPRFAWPATELRVRFTGTGLSLVLADTGLSHWDVAIDAAPPTLLVVTGAARSYDVARGLVEGVHDVTVTRRTESFLGITQLLDVLPSAGGALVPTPAWSGRRIELVGDSITCGYGVLGADGNCPFTAATECEPLAWGALAAKALSAAHVVSAVSGVGVFRNFDGTTTETMPQRYGRALADDPSSASDDSPFVPDVVVVDLGTNDFAGGKGDPGPAFAVAYTRFLATLRARYANAWIVAAMSPMLTEPDRTMLRAYVDAAIRLRGAAGDRRVSRLDIDEQLASDGYGCDSHPSKATHQKMAARLVAHLHVVMGW